MNYLIFSFLRSNSKTKRGVEFRYQYAKSLKFGRKQRAECFNTYITEGYSMKLKQIVHISKKVKYTRITLIVLIYTIHI